MSARKSSAPYALCGILVCAILPPPARGQDRTFDGSGNNAAQPLWGSAGSNLLRISTVEYGDGVSSPAGPARPSARQISNDIAAKPQMMTDPHGMTDFFWLWGQFLDHDIDLTGSAEPAEPLDIPVPMGDPWFDPGSTGTEVIPFSRSNHDPSSGTDAGNPRQHINSITSYIDASNVYGSDATRAAALRLNDGSGRLRTSPGDLLPFNTPGLPNAGGTSAALFLAGDVRANENSALSAVHTLFVREHNRLAAELQAENPGWSGEQIYQRARKIVGAQMQVITYNEFLPLLLGSNQPGPYPGYDANVDASISSVFSTAAYRLGHSMLSATLLRLDANGQPIPEGPLALRDAFFDPSRLTDEGGIEPLLRGVAAQRMQRLDVFLVNDVRNFLFGPPGSGGFDLAALNIQRGRDHGLPNYNQARLDMGLPAVTTFAQITSDAILQQALELAYGTVDDIDVWVGGLAEDPDGGALVGALFCRILEDQFTRLRNCDWFWYQNDPSFSSSDRTALQATRLSDIIRRNTTITGIQDQVFLEAPRAVPASNDAGILALLASFGVLLAAAGARRTDTSS